MGVVFMQRKRGNQVIRELVVLENILDNSGRKTVAPEFHCDTHDCAVNVHSPAFIPGMFSESIANDCAYSSALDQSTLA
jgi:hypothetical protein